jgi:hypothetical protein
MISQSIAVIARLTNPSLPPLIACDLVQHGLSSASRCLQFSFPKYSRYFLFAFVILKPLFAPIFFYNMASIKLSAIVSAARGKVGGNVFSANKAGAFVRTYVKPTNRNTIAQQTVRGRFGTLSSGWRNISAETRGQWNNMAINYPYMNRLGDMATYTGQQLYNKLQGNINACQQGYIIDGSAPAFLNRPQTPQEFFPLVNGMNNIDNTAEQISMINLLIDGEQVTPTSFGIIIEATAPLSAGIESPQKGLFKAIGFCAQNADFTDSALWENLFTGYRNVFGVVPSGSKCYIQVKQISYISGEVTVPQRILATVTG